MKRALLKTCVPVVAGGLTIAMAVGLSTSANADGPAIPGLGGPTSISVGAFWPTSDDAKDAGGSTQFDANLRYHIPVKDNPLTVPARTFLNVGVQAGSKDGNHSTIVPITVGEEIGLDNRSPLAPGNGYLGAGVGAYILNQSGFSTATRLGGFVNAGYNFTSSVFAEADYQFVDHGDGPMVNVGFRF
jgi:hypothetical protein